MTMTPELRKIVERIAVVADAFDMQYGVSRQPDSTTVSVGYWTDVVDFRPLVAFELGDFRRLRDALQPAASRTHEEGA